MIPLSRNTVGNYNRWNISISLFRLNFIKREKFIIMNWIMDRTNIFPKIRNPIKFKLFSCLFKSYINLKIIFNYLGLSCFF